MLTEEKKNDQGQVRVISLGQPSDFKFRAKAESLKQSALKALVDSKGVLEETGKRRKSEKGIINSQSVDQLELVQRRVMSPDPIVKWAAEQML